MLRKESAAVAFWCIRLATSSSVFLMSSSWWVVMPPDLRDQAWMRDVVHLGALGLVWGPCLSDWAASVSGTPLHLWILTGSASGCDFISYSKLTFLCFAALNLCPWAWLPHWPHSLATRISLPWDRAEGKGIGREPRKGVFRIKILEISLHAVLERY